jgi:hypothetical protein
MGMGSLDDKSAPVGGDSVSPYLRIKLRDAPKPRIQKPQEQPAAEPESGTPPREVPRDQALKTRVSSAACGGNFASRSLYGVRGAIIGAHAIPMKFLARLLSRGPSLGAPQSKRDSHRVSA